LISFGSHAISHQNLTKLSHNLQIDEITKSKSVIEYQLKSLVTGFSYPLGFSDNNVINILKEAGYKYAITTIPGVNNGDIDFFKLKRISAVNNFHLFKFYLICQSGRLYNLYNKLVRTLFV
jgi:peptidoglycan/xylan/chitin deacetylase (PgdA/CDA1 family)